MLRTSLIVLVEERLYHTHAFGHAFHTTPANDPLVAIRHVIVPTSLDTRPDIALGHDSADWWLADKLQDRMWRL